jgi:RNA polymerase sigma factor (sigma-70 family)
VAVRLLSELKRGRRYPVPYRVVVHKVIEWTTKGFYERGRATLVAVEDDLPEDVFRAGNPFDDVETRYDLERALAEIPEGDREIARLRYLEGAEIEDIAQRLGKKRNAVDQALFRGRGPRRCGRGGSRASRPSSGRRRSGAGESPPRGSGCRRR